MYLIIVTPLMRRREIFTQQPQPKKTSQQNPFAHIINVQSKSLTMSVGKTKSVYISLIII